MAGSTSQHTCPGDDTIAGFLEHALSAERRRAFEMHLDTCEACRGVLADAALPGSSDGGREAVPANDPETERVLPGYVVAGKYEILREIGRGGMGCVYSARHVGLDKHVAVKVLHPELGADTGTVRRFMREARSAAKLTSEHAVRIHDVDQVPSGLPYLVMELLDGEDLETLCSRQPLSVEQAVSYVRDAAEAVAEAHGLGLVHRDLKPQNLFLARMPNGAYRVKVLDFGLVKELHVTGDGSSLTADTTIVGTPHFMSPEQARSPREVDARTDIWALGATLFKLLTGRPPFESDTVHGILARILSDRTPSVRQLRPDVPPALEAVIERALQKSPNARFAGVGAFVAALREADIVTESKAAAGADATQPAPSRATQPGVSRTVPLAEAPERDSGPTAVTVVERASRAKVPSTTPAAKTTRFRLAEALGAGGMGDVYRAHDALLDRAVAVKVLRGSDRRDDAQRRRRVVREARAAAALTHPNTVTIFDVVEDGDRVFIAMELLEGSSLRAIIARGEASLEEKLRWLRESARALAAAHERGLVHRDVKPENMFVCRDGTLKLLDFGIAKRDDDAPTDTDAPPWSLEPSSLQTSEGRVVGTPRYMSPEQREGRSTDARSDQYSWGLVARELLAQALTPTPRPESENSSAPDERRAGSALPERLVAALARTLEAESDRRFPSMASLLEVLEAPIADAEGSADAARPARPAILGNVAATPPARSRARVIATLGAITALALGAAAITVAKVRSRPQGRSSCEVLEPRTFDVAAEDRAGTDGLGSVVVARSIDQGLRLEREDGATWAPVPLPPHLAAMGGAAPFRGATIMGVEHRREPSLAVVLDQGGERGALLGYFSATEGGSRRMPGPLSGLAVAALNGSTVALTTQPRDEARGRASAVEVHRLDGQSSSVIERTAAANPAIAGAEGAVALTYSTEAALRFALLDAALNLTRDVITVRGVSAASAVVFDGVTASVFWVERTGDGMRLFNASLGAGHAAFSPARVVLSDEVEPAAPVALAVGKGEWALAWVARSTEGSVLRLATVDGSGSLSRPVDVARAPHVSQVQMAPRVGGARILWHESATRVGAARAACGSGAR